jgi:hypothetical protein
MEVRVATEAAPNRPQNEDYAIVLPGLVGVFDGVTAPAGIETGCVHGPAWYVRQLATHLSRVYVQSAGQPLTDLLAEAIERVRGDHDGLCDLSHPGTPASTVTLLRENALDADYLVLGDSPIVAEQQASVRVITDDRHDKAVAVLRATALDGQNAIGSDDHAARVRYVVTKQWELANRSGGYWIAAANPLAAHEAVTGTLPLRGPERVSRAALLTDGTSCAVTDFSLYDWQGLLDALSDEGPQRLIARVRTAERADMDGYSRPRYKMHDDATAAICLFDEQGE